MNNKIKIGLLALPIAAALTACGSGGDDYIPDASDADYAALNAAIIAHPGMNCYMEWGNGVYINNCVQRGYVIPYSVHVYYPRTGYCGCLSVAPRPSNYRPVYVNKTTYQKTVINKQTNVTVNNNGSKPAPAKPAPRDAVPPSTGSRPAPARPAPPVSRPVVSGGRG